MGILDETNETIGFIIMLITFLGSIAYAWSTYRSNKNRINDETIRNYEQSIKSFEIRLAQLENDNREKDKKIEELTAQLNKLSGAKTILEQTLALRDPELFKKLSDGLTSMTNLCKIFYTHNDNAIKIRKTQETMEKEVAEQIKTSNKLIEENERQNEYLKDIDDKIIYLQNYVKTKYVNGGRK